MEASTKHLLCIIYSGAPARQAPLLIYSQNFDDVIDVNDFALGLRSSLAK